MEQFFLYSVKTGVCISVFYAVYYFFLSTDTAYVRNRTYLLLSIAISLIIPVLSLPQFFNFGGTVAGTTLSQISLPQANQVVVSDSPENAGVSPLRLLSAFYFIGMILFSVKMASGIFRLLTLIRRNKISGRVVKFDGLDISGFSAAGLVFINKKLSGESMKKVLLHENIHNSKFHFLDALLLEILTVFQWMNPIIYMVRYSLRAVHEYQTDREIIKNPGEIKNYQQILLNEVFGSNKFALVSCFSTSSLIKKRFIMMTKKETSRIAVFKLFIAIPALTLLIALFSCSEKVEVQKDLEPANVSYSTHLINSRLIADNALCIVDGKETKPSEVREMDPSEIHSLNILRDAAATKIYGARGVNGVILIITNTGYEKQKQYEDVFMVVEDMPTFEGGDVQKFTNWVKERVKYPEIAVRNGIQGRVFIGFIVEKDGSVSNIQILRSVDRSLDEEAVRVVQSSPSWKPGLQRGEPVRVRFSITVNFVLG